MADLATLQARLIEAETAYHKLLTGAQEVEVEHGDMRLKYANSVTQLERLLGYINNLKAQIVAAGGTVDGLLRSGIEVDLPG